MYLQIMAKFQNVFVTVGTTDFDGLLRSIDDDAFPSLLKALGCIRLTIQKGRGVYSFKRLESACDNEGISLDVYRFKATLAEDMSKADAIISHCGAGTVIESVSMKKFLIVVVNPSLQGNHQRELADAMAGQGWCLATEPGSLFENLKELAADNNPESRIKPYPEVQPKLFSGLIDSLFDF